jgi:hypothetical protein
LQTRCNALESRSAKRRNGFLIRQTKSREQLGRRRNRA